MTEEQNDRISSDAPGDGSPDVPAGKDPENGGKAGERAALRAGYLRFLLRLAGIALVGLVLFTKVFLITQAHGQDMFPAVKDGDLLLAFRLEKEHSKNDVVVYTCDGKRSVGRIAAREGDVVTLDESGAVLVNGTVQTGEILYPTFAEGELTYPYRVPSGSVFLLGDHRNAACDSRAQGAIPLGDVEGKVITILRRRGL